MYTSVCFICLDEMMPPKKSKAARKSNFSSNDYNNVDVVTDDPNDGEAQMIHENDADDDTKDEYFEPVVIDGKRKRSTPQTEKTLRDWWVDLIYMFAHMKLF